MRLPVLVLWAALAATACGDDWPQLRGPDRTGISKEKGLLKEWPAAGPALRWKATDIGTGYSAPSIAKGFVYLQTTKGGEEHAIALEEKTGKPVWSSKIGKIGKNTGPDYPGTRSTPTVDGDRLYCLASDGELVCLDTAGKEKWRKHLRTDFDGKPGACVYSESVLIDGDKLICTPGGTTAALVALNKMSGEVIWKAPMTGMGSAEYASVMVVETGSVRQYVQFLRQGMVGVNAKNGELLWKYGKTIDMGANILTPVIAGNRVFSAGGRTGGGLVELTADGDKVAAKELYFEKALGTGIGGAVLLDGLLFATGATGLFCTDFATGKVKWTDRSVDAASVCFADGRLYVRGHGSGDVALVEPSAEKYIEKGRLKQAERTKVQAWPHPAVANGGLYLRDQGALLCYEITAK